MRTVLGLDRLEEFEGIFRGKRIGLITNYSGVDSLWRVNVDLFMDRGLRIGKLFTPEHGMFGEGAGKEVGNDVYPGYQIPICSLYGNHLRPEAEELADIDILVYDIQDVGLRYYTYIYTMTYCMEAAARADIPFVVLDRPNPLGNRIVSGGTILPEFASFIGDYGLPVRYGLTCGEVGHYFLAHRGLKLDYRVIPMENYTRDTYFSDTGLLWNIPSPALVDFHSTICYCGGCFLEGSSLSAGRGSSKPFQMYGAPYVKMEELYREMKAAVKEDKVIFRQRAFVPVEREYAGEVCFGLEFAPLDKTLDFIPTALQLMRQVVRLYPEQFTLSDQGQGNKHLHYLAGGRRIDDYLYGILSLEELLEEWRGQSARFEKETEAFRIYG